MRFLTDGADIPDELIGFVAGGDSVFLCGAGVSKSVGMYSFKELTEKVYESLPATREDQAPEEEAFRREEYDRVLRVLEKRTRRANGSRSRVREVVSQLLRARDETPLANHMSLIELSRDSAGRPRLLTTNFDTLFERAANLTGDSAIPSHAGKAMPKPGATQDFGILHLHGRIGDPDSAGDTDLTLTSSDFGDAYLRDGWASRYIEDRMRLNILVLVGYGANDTAFRLLLDALDADREIFRDIRKIYALDKSGPNTDSHWRAKGIQPIEFNDHDSIYATLAEWAKYNASPISYQRRRISEIAVKTPDEASEFEQEQLKFMLFELGGIRRIIDLEPRFAWLPYFVQWGLIRESEPALLVWIGRNLASDEAVRAIVGNISLLTPKAADAIDEALRRRDNTAPEYLVKSWRLIERFLRNHRPPAASLTWLHLQGRVRDGDTSPRLFADIASALRPKLILDKKLDATIVESGVATGPGDLMAIGFEVDDVVSAEDMLNALPTLSDESYRQLLDYVTLEIDAALDDAVQSGVEGKGREDVAPGWGRSDSDVASVAASPQNDYRSGFLAVTRFAAEIILRLLRCAPDSALLIIDRWRQSPFRLFRRLALFACENALVPCAVAASAIQSTPQSELFLTGSAVEVIRLLRSRWNDWSVDARHPIETRLRLGPPAACFYKEHERAVDSSIFAVLATLREEGFPLDSGSLTTLERIEKRWPDWRPRAREQAGFHIWVGSPGTSPSDSTALANVSDSEIVTESRHTDESTWPGSQETWGALCRQDPARALRALRCELDASRVPEAEWKIFLNTTMGASDANLARNVSVALFDIPEDGFGPISQSVSSWLAFRFNDLDHEQLWAIWDRIADLSDTEHRHVGDDDDLLQVAVSSSGGILSRILVQRVTSEVAVPSERPEMIDRLDRLLTADGSFGALARVILAAELARLHHTNQVWVEENFIPFFDWTFPESRSLWLARANTRYLGSPRLFELTKIAFLQLFRRSDISEEKRAIFAEWLAVMVESNRRGTGGYDLTLPEAHSAMRKAGIAGLQRLARRLETTLLGEAPEDRAATWQNVVKPIFQELWPHDFDLRSPLLAPALTRVLLRSGAAFQDAAEVILPFIEPSPMRCDSTLLTIADEGADLFDKLPEQMLRLIAAVVGQAPHGSVFTLGPVLKRLSAAPPSVTESRAFQMLQRMAAVL